MIKEDARLIRELTLHPWWKILEQELTIRIGELETLLYTAGNTADGYNLARMERKAIKQLLEEPELIISSFTK